MLQPSKFSRSSLDLQNTDLRTILADTALGRLWQALSQFLHLPNDLVSFLLFLTVLSVLCGGLFLHIHLSARIMQTRISIGDQRTIFEAIEQKNSEIVWQINQATSLDVVKQRAAALGYVDMPDHQYIGATQVSQALLPGSSVAASLGLVSTSAAGALASNDSISGNGPSSLLASSASNTAAPNQNSTNASAELGNTSASLNTSTSLNMSTTASTASPAQTRLENVERGWRQWIHDWLPLP